MHGWDTRDVPTLLFSVIAETSHGSSVRVVGSPDVLGRWEPSRGLTLQTDSGKYPLWWASVRIPSSGPPVEYKYVVVGPDGSAIWEDGGNRSVAAGAAGQAEATTPVFRNPRFEPKRKASTAAHLVPVPTAPAPASVRAPAPEPVRPVALQLPARQAGGGAEPAEPAGGGNEGSEELLFEAVCTCTAPGDILRVVGSSDMLGNWNTKRGLQLTTSGASFPRWSGATHIPHGTKLEWKLVICQASGNTQWEPSDNRHTALQPGWDGAWLVRVHWGGACSAPEKCPSMRPRSRSQPGTPSQGTDPTFAQLRRTSTELGSPPASSSWMVAAPVLAPVPAAPPNLAGAAAPPTADEPLEAAPRPWARSTSLSHLGALIGSDGLSSVPLSALTRPRRTATESLEDQLVTFTLDAVDAQRAAAVVVEVFFVGDGSKWRLRLEPQEPGCTQARWSLGLVQTGLMSGVHLVHFLVGGKRCVSRDLPVFGDDNGLLFSEPLRRYILARDERQAQDGLGGNDHVPLSHSRTLPRLGSDSLGGGLGGGLAPKGGHFTDDTDVGVPGQTKGNMPRPFSICGNLMALGDDEDESGGMDSKSGVASFSKEVFEGLYDGELRLRMDGFMLPEPAPHWRPVPLRLWTGAQMLKKKVGACEDYFFHDDHALGVADGVGCMVQFASYGINAAEYAKQLMLRSAEALRQSGAAENKESAEKRAVAALSAAEKGAQAYGASTITVMTLDGSTMGCANLGDSGFMHLRKGHRGMQVVRKSEEQQHSWNCPYQLTRLPQTLISRFPRLSLDSAEDCEQYSFTVREGDLILLFTDGLRDNLHEREILHIVDCALSPAFGELVGLREHSTTPEKIARSLALAAQERSMDPSAKVPFVEYSKKHGYECQGGKQDDITVVAAWVVPEEPPGVDDAMAAVAEAPLVAEPAEPEAPAQEAGADNKEAMDSIERNQTLMNILSIGAEDTEPNPTGATGAGQPAVEDTASGKASELPPTDAEVTNSVPDGIGGSKGGENSNNITNGESTSDECKALDERATTPPGRPAVGDDSAGGSPHSTEGAKAGRSAQPTYETPRRGSLEPSSTATAGTQRRQPPCRAEFRPLSSSSKGQDASKSRGAQRAAASGKRAQG